jgi:hypothetical protein
MPGVHSWSEVTIDLPFLQTPEGGSPVAMQIRSFMNSSLAVLGDAIVAYNAKVAPLSTKSQYWTDLQLSDKHRKPIINAAFSAASEFTPANSVKDPFFKTVKSLKDQRMLGLRKLFGKEILECSGIVYEWDKTEVRPSVTGKIEFSESPCPGIAAGTSFTFDGQHTNAVEAQATFRLTFPHKCPYKTK